MDKHGAAATGDTGPRVVIKLEKNIVESVIAPEAVTWFIGRSSERAIVAPIGWIFTPGVGGTDPAKGQRCPRARKAIRPPSQPHRAKPAVRRAPIALAFIGPDAGVAERDG